MVNLSPVDGLIQTKDELNEGGVICVLQELDRLMTGGAAVVLSQSRDDGVGGRAEVHEQDPGIGSCGVKVLEDEVEGHVYCIVYRLVGSVGELQGIQEWVSDGFKV